MRYVDSPSELFSLKQFSDAEDESDDTFSNNDDFGANDSCDNDDFIRLCEEAELKQQKKKETAEQKTMEIEEENESVEKKTVEKEAAEKEVVEKEAVGKEAAEKEVVEKEAVEKEAAEKEVVEKEAVEKEAVEKEAAEKEAVEKEATQAQALITQREHRKLIYKRGNCRQRKINMTNFSYIGPRLQHPKSPAKPTLFIAEGAETIKNKRLICPGQFLRICESEYVVVMVYWCGAKPQGRRRYSARSPFYGLLIQCPFLSPLPPPTKTAEQHYCRVEIAELMEPELPNPVSRPHVCQKTVMLMMQHTSVIVTKFGCDTQWWERPVLVKTKLRLDREREAKEIGARLQAAKETAQQAAKEAERQAAKKAERQAAKEAVRQAAKQRTQAKPPLKTKSTSRKRARVTKTVVPITRSSPPPTPPASPGTNNSVQLRILSLLTKLVQKTRTDEAPKPTDEYKDKTTDSNTDTLSDPPTSLPGKRPRTEHQYHPGLQQPPRPPSVPHPPVYYTQNYQQPPRPQPVPHHPPVYYPQPQPMYYPQPVQQHPTPMIYYPQPQPVPMYTQSYPQQPRPMYPTPAYSGSPSHRQIVLNL